MPTGIYRRTAWHRKIMSLCHMGKFRGSKSPSWKGNKATRGTGHSRAIKLFRILKACERCGGKKNLERHHKDGNPLNNHKSNIAILCHVCHMTIDGRMEKIKVLGKYVRTKKMREEARKRGRKQFHYSGSAHYNWKGGITRDMKEYRRKRWESIHI